MIFPKDMKIGLKIRLIFDKIIFGQGYYMWNGKKYMRIKPK